MTRVQKERFFNEADYVRLKDTYIINPDKLEQEIDHVFKLTDRENKIYRCIYCEMKAKN